jgi:hypothetical protein
MKLTTLGKEQLEYTGKRLNQMNIQFDRLIHSGMVRAYESAIIINEQLDSKLQLIEDKNLTEGLPVAPIPYAGISQRDIDVRKTKRNLVFYVKKEIIIRRMVIDQELIQHLQHIFIEHVVINVKKHMILLYFMQIFYDILFASKI